MNKLVTSLVLILMVSVSAIAQPTGYVSDLITFNTTAYPGQDRFLSFGVPANYTPTKKYKIFIGLHGQGSNDSIFCTTLMQVFLQQAYFGDVILVCPDEGAPNTGFLSPAGEDDGIIEAAIAEARLYYNLDTTQIYMTGFSRGARAGLKLGLDKPLKYKGMMLYTPALLSLNEAKNLTTVQFNYTNGKFVPICMTVGASDPNGYPAIDAEVQNQLQLKGAKSILKSIAGLGHNIPQTMQDYIDCYNNVQANLYVPTGINESVANIDRIDIYPNPATTGFYVGLTNEVALDDHIITSVYNVSGQKIYEQEDFYINQIHYVNMDGKAKGLYMVVVSTPSQRFVKKVLVN